MTKKDVPLAAAVASAVRPQAKQESFLATSADIAIFGGAAFAGKTFALLLEPLRHIHIPEFGAVFFRRTTPQIRNEGALWDESMMLYPKLGAAPAESILRHVFPSGASVKFSHLEHDKTVHDWDGSQIPLICFDQLEHFTRHQFLYMLSRNRSMCGVRPYIRATCNPLAGSWLAEFLQWWWDEKTGYPIPERSGKIRFMLRMSDVLHWGDSREELAAQFGDDAAKDALTVTFIAGNIYDNQIGMMRDPGYLGKLKAMARVERERLLGGNWKIRPAAGLLFRREWLTPLNAVPADLDLVRYWDIAATEKTEGNDPDWTVGVKLGRYRNQPGRYVILDARRMQKSPASVELAMRNTAIGDGDAVRVGFPQDPGQAGKSQVRNFTTLLAGFSTWSWSERGDKVTRFMPFSAQCEHGNVDYVVGSYTDDFFSSLENFPDGDKKDDADACSGAFEMHLDAKGMGLLDLMRQEMGKKVEADHEAALEEHASKGHATAIMEAVQ